MNRFPVLDVFLDVVLPAVRFFLSFPKLVEYGMLGQIVRHLGSPGLSGTANELTPMHMATDVPNTGVASLLVWSPTWLTSEAGPACHPALDAYEACYNDPVGYGQALT